MFLARIPTSPGLGAITIEGIEAEIIRRGIYVQEQAPVNILPALPEEIPGDIPFDPSDFVPLPEPVGPFVTFPEPDVLPWPEEPVVVLPGDGGPMPVLTPWIPQFPYLTEPDLTAVYTEPYTEESIFPLTPLELPEGEAPSKSKTSLIVGAVVLAIVALSGGKKRKRKNDKKSNNKGGG